MRHRIAESNGDGDGRDKPAIVSTFTRLPTLINQWPRNPNDRGPVIKNQVQEPHVEQLWKKKHVAAA